MIDGSVLIAGDALDGPASFYAVDPSSGFKLEPAFADATAEHVDHACREATAAFEPYRATSLDDRATFLTRIGDEIAGIGDPLIERAMAETGLPRARLEGERGRTISQLNLFAEVVRRGDWLGVTIDPALPGRQPLPRPDLRLRHIPLGPVAVFGASNFPLAFSVAGGDTASALAAGCPVIVKGHPAHPGTSELVGRAVQRAAAATGMPAGVFALLPGASHALSNALVADARMKAVGFTGSRSGGLALMATAAARSEPIPVFAEMSSINPVILCPHALAARGDALGTAFVASLIMGAGQFCTNPGLVLAIDGPDLDRFLASAAQALAASSPAPMLTPGIHASFERGVAMLESHAGLQTVARGCVGDGINQGRGALFETTAAAFLADPVLSYEVFGSSSLVVRCADAAALITILSALEGQLTATLQMDAKDTDFTRPLIPLLEEKAGRILVNGWPTGVEVAHAMVHGGPFPAASDSRSTSVGALAIHRFLRPVSYQNFPLDLLPAELGDDNPWSLDRRVNGMFEGASA